MPSRSRYAVVTVIGLALVVGTVDPLLSAGPLCDEQAAPPSASRLHLASIVKGLHQPVALVAPDDGTDRLFVVEQPGTIRVVEQGRLLASPLLDIRDKVAVGYEMGLLGMALHPRFPSEPYIYINYTTEGMLKARRTVISELRLAGRDRADRSTERVILEIAQPYPNHKGGHLAFGPDGMFYIGTGDGGSANDPHDNGQSLTTLLGKMLRIDVLHRDGDRPYSVPADNPFVGRPNARPEIWAYGFRNPWRYSFDAATGLLYAADVGQYDREEIDIVKKGGNYGWRVMEGMICTPAVSKTCDRRGFEMPIFDYPTAGNRVVIGGFVYRGSVLKGLCGAYIYGDYGDGGIFALRYDGRQVTAHTVLLETDRKISSFGQDRYGEPYVVDHDGAILKMVPASP